MELIVKPKNKNLKDYTKNADAFLFGIKEFSYIQTSIISLKELKKIKQTTNKKIFIAIDKNIFNKDIEKLKKVLIEINNIKVEGLFFYDLSVLYLTKKLNLDIPLIWNQNYFVTNYKTINHYQKQGVNKAVISSEITIEEIQEIRKNTNVDLFVNIFGYQMMSFSKRKLITNYFKYIKRINPKKNNYMIEKDKKYQVIETKEGTMFLSNEVLNGIKYIKELQQINYLILDENMINHNTFLKILDIYKNNKKEDIKKLIPNESTIFLDKKTIYKVKTK